MPKLYEIPVLYDLAFRRPNIDHHVKSMIECHRRYRPNHELVNILELAAGPARHALQFSFLGYKSTALDFAPHMCKYAADLAAANALTLNVVQANMKDFAIAGRYDLVMTLLNSIGHVYTERELETHLFCVSKHLNDGGLYIIEAHNPPWTARESISCSSWQIAIGECELQVDFGTDDDEFDQEFQIRKLKLHIHGHIQGKRLEYTDILTLRSWSEHVLDRIFDNHEAVEVVAKLGELNANQPFDQNTSARLVYVLRRNE